MSTPIGGLPRQAVPAVTDDTHTDDASGSAPNATEQPQPLATAASHHAKLGALAANAKQVGGKALEGTRNGLEKTEPVLAPTAAGGYELWAANNAVAAVNGLVSNFHGSNEVTSAVAAATNGVGMLPSGLDVASTAVSFTNKTFTLAETSKQSKTAVPDTLEGKDALSAHRQAKGNLARAAPGAIRDVALGGLALGGRIFTAKHPGHSMFGDKVAAVHGDGALGIATGAMYVAGGALQSAKVDRGVDRTQALRSSVLHPPSGRIDSDSEAMRRLDGEFAAGRISPNAYSILRTRSDQDVSRFLDNFAALGAIGQQRFAKLLHFPGEQNAMKVLNMSRTTNLNTASTRRAAREEVIDAFIGKTVKPGRTLDLFNELKTVRSEALGARAAPGVAALERTLRDAHVDPAQFSPNTLKAIAASGRAQAFVERYRTLSPEGGKRLQSTLHFGSWRFWKRDATLPTTKHQRSDIRSALIGQFADGASLDRLDAMKLRYNQKVLPLQTGRTHARQAPTDTMRAHILAYQDNTLDSLKEEKRHAKILIGYGVVNAAAGVAELAVNPAAAAGVSASRAALSPFYLAYAGRRGVVGEINRQNAKPIDAAMREEALLHALPQVHERIEAGDADTRRVHDRPRFLRDELGLNDADIRKLDTLERSGKHAEARAWLAQQRPEANVLIALRVLADESAGHGSNLQQHNALGFIAAQAAESRSAPLAGIHKLSDPDETFATLKAHFIDNASYDPSSNIGTLAQKLSAGTATLEYGFDKARYAGRPAQDIAQDLQQRFARDNPSFATRRLVADLFGGGERAVAARNMLRDFRFSETEIGQLGKMEKKDASTWLESHLFGENLRRRFSTQMLDQEGRDKASAVADRMPAHEASADEPLTWRRNLEDVGVNVIDNAGTPGLDSMLHALYQHLGGKTDSSSSTLHRKVMEARRQVIAQVTRGAPGAHVDVTRHRDAIVQVAGRVFGKPDATVKIVSSSGQGQAERVGARRDDRNAPVSAVLCYDEPTGRTFALHGGDAGKLKSPAPQIPLSTIDTRSFAEDVFDTLESRAETSSPSGSIENADDLHSFITGARPFGAQVETGASSLLSDRNRLFEYRGLVFRGDSRTPQQIRNAGGFQSRRDLGVPENLLEAQGLAVSKGATGQSGVSTAKRIEHALPYCNSGARDGYIYVVDTRRLPANQHAYDMAGITVNNGYKDTDETGGEVNVTHIPTAAIVGWLAVENADDVIDHPQGMASIANIRNKIQMNPEYA